jgi:hypothetical protein
MDQQNSGGKPSSQNAQDTIGGEGPNMIDGQQMDFPGPSSSNGHSNNIN